MRANADSPDRKQAGRLAAGSAGLKTRGSAETYRRLVFQEWWTAFEGVADKQGLCAVPAFFGRHRVEAAGRSAEVDLPKEKGKVEARVGAD